MTGVGAFIVVGIIGAIAQVVDGSLGMGFGVFSTSLMIGAGFAPAVAVAVVNMSKIFTGLASGLSHWKFGNVRWDWFTPLVLSGVVGGVLGAYLLTSVPPQIARPVVSGLLLVMGGLMIWRSLRWRTADTVQVREGTFLASGHTGNRILSRISALGFVAAFMNGLSGAYGPIATSGMVLMEKHQPRYAIGTVNMAEVFVAGAVATTILFRQGLSGFPLGLVLALVIGGVLVAPLAAFICRRLSPRVLTFATGTLLVASNIKLVSLILH